MDETWPTSPDDLVRAYETAVEQHGESHAVTEMARMYGVPLRTAYGRLAVAGVRDMRDVPSKPPPDELRAVYESAIAAHGERGAIRKMALATGVDYVTIRKWLIADGLRAVKPRAGAPRPITDPCPCGAVATTRYRNEDPPLCFRCYMRRYASDPDSSFRRAGRLAVAGAKKDQPCADCGGVFHSCVMDFDHVPERGAKVFHLGRADRSLKSIEEELAKCDIVCANCHRMRTWNRSHGQVSEPAS